MLAVSEAIVRQLYIAVLVARQVGLHMSRNRLRWIEVEPVVTELEDVSQQGSELPADSYAIGSESAPGGVADRGTAVVYGIRMGMNL